MKARKMILGEKHPNTLDSMHAFAISYNEVNRRQKALQLRERMMKARKRILDEKHSNTLDSMHAFANSYSEVNRRQEALQLRERMVKAYKRILDEEHSNIVASICTLMNLKKPSQDATRTYQRSPSAQKKSYA